MSKRQKDDRQLRPHEVEQLESKSEEAGVFVRAPQEKLAKRRIVRARKPGDAVQAAAATVGPATSGGTLAGATLVPKAPQSAAQPLPASSSGGGGEETAAAVTTAAAGAAAEAALELPSNPFAGFSGLTGSSAEGAMSANPFSGFHGLTKPPSKGLAATAPGSSENSSAVPGPSAIGRQLSCHADHHENQPGGDVSGAAPLSLFLASQATGTEDSLGKPSVEGQTLGTKAGAASTTSAPTSTSNKAGKLEETSGREDGEAAQGPETDEQEKHQAREEEQQEEAGEAGEAAPAASS
uniref:Nuclear pore complex NUP2/50/61 domain-containing protein n=1 Tax=Rhizochromulina marina TaxID=1034831 RepID=A0A7S2RQD4_9STRA|mmetsp:Transcript_1952/g.5756  ORF Transcript_1952/g.5756 Transcript_1952/m.5756 type:complete len:295 (+) Transcript_1952:60-944(+)